MSKPHIPHVTDYDFAAIICAVLSVAMLRVTPTKVVFAVLAILLAAMGRGNKRGLECMAIALGIVSLVMGLIIAIYFKGDI